MFHLSREVTSLFFSKAKAQVSLPRPHVQSLQIKCIGSGRIEIRTLRRFRVEVGHEITYKCVKLVRVPNSAFGGKGSFENFGQGKAESFWILFELGSGPSSI